jgi:hypothetical protein
MENNLIVTLHTLGLGKTCWSFSQARSWRPINVEQVPTV